MSGMKSLAISSNLSVSDSFAKTSSFANSKYLECSENDATSVTIEDEECFDASW